jgi:hypothetical protein
VTRPSGSSLVVPGPDKETHLAIMSGFERRGMWVVPERMTVVAFWGGAELDLRQARFAAQECIITINAVMGGAQVIVPPHVNVRMEGTGIMGGYSGPSGLVDAQVTAVSPTVRIRGVAIMGGVNVERKHGK